MQLIIRVRTAILIGATTLVAIGGPLVFLEAQQPPAASAASAEWTVYGGTASSTRYSSLDQINKQTVKDLRIVWRQSATPAEVRRGRTNAPVPTNYQNTPLMVGGLLYMTTGYGSVTALDPATGKVVWFDDLPGDQRGSPTRGVGYWTDGLDARILAVVGSNLVALNAKTGARYPAFGAGGQVDLKRYDDHATDSYGWQSPPLVVRDVVVIGSDSTRTRNTRGRQAPGDIRGYDVRTGRLLWTFHTPPRAGEFGADTWLGGTFESSGFTNAWAAISADETLGYVYLPLKQSTGYSYGGGHPGANLFGNSLLCLDARTGKRVWHFQAVHHDMWDYDLPAAPILIDLTVSGRPVRALAQISKMAFVYVLDRVTGQPIWPIEERPVPKGDIPGEWYSPTQPFPTKPPPYDQQGVTIDDLIDFTPELRQEAIKIISQYRYGSLFTPLSAAEARPDGKKGSIQMPGTVGVPFSGAAADPETGMLYVPSNHSPIAIELIKTDDVLTPWASKRGNAVFGSMLEGPQGLPIFKPPYGRLTAIDLNRGEIRWTTANGNGPRDHPAIKHLNLPPLGQPGRATPLVTKTMVFLGEGGSAGVPLLPPGGGGKMFRAYDKATGAVLWEMELPGGTTGAPMSYLLNGKQYLVVSVGWKDVPGELVALALP
jgi:quinoprotein glucose dehydrogenase